VRRAAHDADLLAGIVGRVVADCEPAFVRDEAGAEVVILSAADFSAWQETVYLLSSPANAAHLQASLRQAKGGKHANAGCHDHKLTSMRPGPPAGWRSA
jgi:antitoxin YefM